MELSGAHVLVTGASRGIGAELVRQFAVVGARATALARSEGALNQLVEETSADTGYVVADLASPEGREGLIARVEAQRGPVDILVNNAGIEASGDFTRMAPAELERVVALNLVTPIELSRQALGGMLARERGHIVNISSIAGAGTFPGLATYSATKAGLTHFTAALRTELKGTAVRTTVVEVGFVNTDMRESALEYEPGKRAYDRIQRLHLMPDTPIEQLCEATVDAVRRDRRHVRYPGRMRGMMLLAEAPRRTVEWTYAGLRTRL